MSELPEIEPEAPLVWRVKKMPDNAIYGPVDETTLKEWANSAQISPQDMIDTSDEDWKPAPEVEFLEMLWMVKLPGDELYGPTSVGTLREFIQEGLITEKTAATNINSHQVLPIGALFAALDFEKGRALRSAAQDGLKSTASLAVDMAKDQRIRQLEEDLRTMRKELESLTHKYRQLTLELQGSKKPGRR
jgi:ribosomal protein L19E